MVIIILSTCVRTLNLELDGVATLVADHMVNLTFH